MKKTIGILGDSYSTYLGWIPADYEAWYNDNGNCAPNDMTAVQQTWWWQLCQPDTFELVANCSYSGSTVCNTGYDQLDASETSFIKRMYREFGEGVCSLDILLVFGGTNDFWAGSPIGSEKYADWTKDDLKEFAPAFCYMMDYLKKTHVNTKIYNIINDDITGPVRDRMIQICKHFEIPCIQLENVEKENGHPNQRGMRQIFEQISAVIS